METLVSLFDKLNISWNSANEEEIVQVYQKIRESQIYDEMLKKEDFYITFFPIFMTSLEVNVPSLVRLGSLMILKDLASKLVLDEVQLKNFNISIFSFIKRREPEEFIDPCLSILHTLSKRGGMYTESVKLRLFFTDYIDFLAMYNNKRPAILLLTSFDNFDMTTQNLERFCQLVTADFFSDDDRLELFIWLFNVVPNSFQKLTSQIILPFLYMHISNGTQKNRENATKCISNIIEKMKSIIDFDYSVIFANVNPEFPKTSIASLDCISMIARIGPPGVKFLISFGLGKMFNDLFKENRPIKVQKSAARCVADCVLNCDRPDIGQFIDNFLVGTLVNLMEIEDNDFLDVLFKAFYAIIGNNDDQYSTFFFQVFSEASGWNFIDDMMINEDIPTANRATVFYHNYNESDLNDLDELPSFDEDF